MTGDTRSSSTCIEGFGVVLSSVAAHPEERSDCDGDGRSEQSSDGSDDGINKDTIEFARLECHGKSVVASTVAVNRRQSAIRSVGDVDFELCNRIRTIRSGCDVRDLIRGVSGSGSLREVEIDCMFVAACDKAFLDHQSRSKTHELDVGSTIERQSAVDGNKRVRVDNKGRIKRKVRSRGPDASDAGKDGEGCLARAERGIG